MNKRIPTLDTQPRGLELKRVGRPLAGPLPVPDTPEGRLSLRIRRLRTQRLLSQAQLAGRMSELGQPWHQTTVAKTERAERELRYPELLALAEVLDVPISELLGEETPQPTAEAFAQRKRDLDRWLLERRLQFVEEDLADLLAQRQALQQEIEALNAVVIKQTPVRTRKT